MKKTILFFASLSIAFCARGVTILGSDTNDTIKTNFFSQQTNANRIIDGLNANATHTLGTNVIGPITATTGLTNVGTFTTDGLTVKTNANINGTNFVGTQVVTNSPLQTGTNQPVNGQRALDLIQTATNTVYGAATNAAAIAATNISNARAILSTNTIDAGTLTGTAPTNVIPLTIARVLQTQGTNTQLTKLQTLGTNKGDIATYDGTNWNKITPSATNGNVLTELSSTAMGYKFLPQSGGGGTNLPDGQKITNIVAIAGIMVTNTGTASLSHFIDGENQPNILWSYGGTNEWLNYVENLFYEMHWNNSSSVTSMALDQKGNLTLMDTSIDSTGGNLTIAGTLSAGGVNVGGGEVDSDVINALSALYIGGGEYVQVQSFFTNQIIDPLLYYRLDATTNSITNTINSRWFQVGGSSTVMNIKRADTNTATTVILQTDNGALIDGKTNMILNNLASVTLVGVPSNDGSITNLESFADSVGYGSGNQVYAMDSTGAMRHWAPVSSLGVPTIYAGRTNITAIATTLVINIGHTMPSTNYTPSVSIIGSAVTGISESFTAIGTTSFTVNFGAALGVSDTNLLWTVIEHK